MLDNTRVWLKDRYNKILNSIAFYPAFIGLMFLVLSYVAILFDFSEAGKQIKSQLPPYTSLKDASTARSIISAIVSGVISLTVFSFSMVMIVLNQAASQLSNRVLNQLIGNRFQQIVLGIYIGTIVFALFLLTSVRDIDAGIYVPALSTYLLILLTIIDIFIFIYFLHYITQSVKYEVIIGRVYKDTRKVMDRACALHLPPAKPITLNGNHYVLANSTGIYEGFDTESLVQLADESDCLFYALHTPGTFVLQGLPILQVSKPIDPGDQKEAARAVQVSASESVEENFFYGMRQLSEIGMKALSPGINDPGTAIIATRSLFQLLAHRINHFPANEVRNKDQQVRILIEELTFDTIFAKTVLPVWDYGKEDRLVQNEMAHLLTQLLAVSSRYASVGRLLADVKQKINAQSLTA
jgi:uncharacterized membrane protein